MNWDAAPTGRRGCQQAYSGEEDQKTVRGTVFPTNAIRTCLSMKVLFDMAFRQTTGFVESLLRLVGLGWRVPDFSTLSRRQKKLAVNIPHRGSKGPQHLLIDSTDIKVESVGEWPARKHGGPNRRVWRKIRSGVGEKTLEVRDAEVTGSHIGDAPVLPDLLNQIPAHEKSRVGAQRALSMPCMVRDGVKRSLAREAGAILCNLRDKRCAQRIVGSKSSQMF